MPVPNEVPPVEAEYQLIVPAEAVAPMVTAPVPQVDPGVVPVIVGIALTVAIVVPAKLGQLLTVMVTEYVPVAAVVAFVIEGF